MSELKFIDNSLLKDLTDYLGYKLETEKDMLRWETEKKKVNQDEEMLEFMDWEIENVTDMIKKLELIKDANLKPV